MKAEDILGMMVPLTYLFFFATERMFPRRAYPKVKLWWLVGFVFLILIGTISTVLPLMIPPALSRFHLLPGDRLGVVAGVVVGYLTLSLCSASVHYAFHHVNFLWRTFHQMHHSPRRLDIPGSVFFHPTEMVLGGAIGIAVTVFLLGLDPLAAAIVGYLVPFYGMFQHWNVRTPRWAGYLIQRPESHGEHHEKGIHGRNYSDFPLWDILFGTFTNPERFDGEVGFEGDAPRRVGSMLAFRDVNAQGGPVAA